MPSRSKRERNMLDEPLQMGRFSRSMRVASTVSAAAIAADTITVTTSQAVYMVFRLTPFCRCMGRLSWKEHSPQINRNRPEKTVSPPPRYIMLGLTKWWSRKKRMCTATTMP